MHQERLDELRATEIARHLASLVEDGDDIDNVCYGAEAGDDRLIVTVAPYGGVLRRFELVMREVSK